MMENKKSSQVTYYIIEADYAGQRIDNFLINKLKKVPKTHIYRILRKGEVRVNKKRIQPNYRIQENDSIRVPPIRLDQPQKPISPSDQFIKLLKSRILFEDKLLIILNKPSGIPVHGGSAVKLGLVEAMRSLYPHSPHLELAHRLDAETSGCLILVKKRSILKEVHELLREGKVSKLYLALTKGQWKKSDLRVDVPLKKNVLSSGERIVKMHPEGKSSLTIFKSLTVYPNSNATLVQAELHTGRTHQIRVHSQVKGHPVAGDDKYGDKVFNKAMRAHGLKRLFLHSHQIDFILPSTGQRYAFTAPLDKDLEDCLSKL